MYALSRKIYTLGSDRRSEEDFIEILAGYDISVVVDVRRFPTSKMPLFKREYLETLLQSEKMGYHWMGGELGGFRKGGYESYTHTGDFGRGIDKLEEIISAATSVILCAEKLPWKCHRRWIARELHRRGWRVEHIIDKGKVWVPK